MNFDDTKDKLTKAKADPAAARINKLHKECFAGMRTTLQKAIEIGKLLDIQKAKCGYGKWIPWIEENLEFGDEQARRYMRCFDKRDKLPKATSKWDFPAIEDFIRQTEEPKAVVAELVVEPSLSSNAARLAFPSKNGGTPVKLGGRPLAMMQPHVPTYVPNDVSPNAADCKRAQEHLALACRFAQLGGLSGDELLEALISLFPQFNLTQTQS